MFETGRRSAISTSELGLYSDRGDRYNRSRYGIVIRKVVIGIMAVVAIVLAAIFIYDFASGASASSKVSQETKHIYILQNALKKPSGSPRRLLAGTTVSPIDHINGTRNHRIQDRSDNADSREITYVDDTASPREDGDARRSQSSEDSEQQRESLVVEETDGKNDTDRVQGKQLFNNHAIVYRVRQRYKYPDPAEELNVEESRPVPFHFELKTPQPASFDKRPKFPQLSQYRYPHTSRNIQDILKYLTNNANAPNRGIKFTGVYINPKKYDGYPEAGELMANSDRNGYQMDSSGGSTVGGDYDDDDDEEVYQDEPMSESSRFSMGHNGDPFYMYKPRHPTDVNLLAASNVRFSQTGTHRYNPYYDPFFQRPAINYPKPIPPQVPIQEMQYSDSLVAHSNGNYGKRKKPKPFSVMLDIYPITDLQDTSPSNKISRPRMPISFEPYESRRPLLPPSGNRAQRYHPAQQTQPIPLIALPAASHSAGPAGHGQEDERQQMIFHLNLYPRKKNKLNRNDIIHRSESMRPEEHDKFMHSVMSPFDAITKQLTDHSNIEESKYEETDLPEPSEPPTDTAAADDDDSISNSENYEESDDDRENAPTSAELVKEEEAASIEKNLTDTRDECKNCRDPRRINSTNYSNTDIDTPEGFQAFADGLIATD